MQQTPQKGPIRRSRHRGSIIAIATAFMIALLALLGITLYIGMNSFVQTELQKAANSSAMIAASAIYDAGTPTVPAPGTVPLIQRPAADIQGVASAIFNRFKAANPTLNRPELSVTLTGATMDPAVDTVNVTSTATIPTPFLSFIGFTSYQLQGNATARYMRTVIAAKNQITGIQINPAIRFNTVDGSVFTADANNTVGSTSAQGTWYTWVELPYPLANGPGFDIRINPPQPNGAIDMYYRGYMIEACTADPGECIDITRAAKLANPNVGLAIDRDYGLGNIRRVVYGPVFIDLWGTNTAAAGGAIAQYGPAQDQVFKATRLKIVDDGIRDHLNSWPGGFPHGAVDPALNPADGVSALLIPDPVVAVAPPAVPPPIYNQIDSIEIYRYAMLCGGLCSNPPKGLESGPGALTPPP